VNLAKIVEPHPDAAVAYLAGGRRVTYGELRLAVAAVRAGLGARGVAPGSRVAIVLPASVDFVVAYLGVLGAGAVAVPLNPSSPPAELARELEAVRPRVAVVAGAPAGTAAGALGATAPARATVAELVTEGSARAETAPVAEREDDDPAVLLFTSGTAGFPKAAVLTHGSLRANIEQIELAVGVAARPEDVGILLVPPFHVFGLNAVLGVQLYAGSATVLPAGERFDPAATLELVEGARVTLLVGVPTVFAALADLPGARGDELRSVRLALSGAAPLSPEVAERFRARFGLPLWQGYGLTEASPAVCFPDVSGPWRPGSVGVPLPGVEVRLVDEDGEDVEPGDPGEVLVRGPNVFAGYFEDPAASAAALDRAGWLHTGDVAVMDEAGALTIVDRRKDLIIVSGFNVFPAEVEEVLVAHPGVREAVVVGVPDPVHGEAVAAYVVPEAGLDRAGGPAAGPHLDPEELVRHCSRHLARYKCPSRVELVAQLPTSAQGKPLRRALR